MQVFRTYNASETLQNELPRSTDVMGKLVKEKEVRMHTHTYAHTYAYTYAYTYTYTYTYNTLLYARRCTHAHTQLRKHTRLQRSRELTSPSTTTLPWLSDPLQRGQPQGRGPLQPPEDSFQGLHRKPGEDEGQGGAAAAPNQRAEQGELAA